MSPALFIISIACYLLSMVGGLIAAFFIKLISPRFINTLIICHALVFITWLFFRNDTDTLSNPGNSNYLFLAFFCSGVFTASMLLRSAYPLYLKIYYAIYLLSIVIFVISPSRVLGFAASGNLTAINPTRIHITENYYLVEQQNATGDTTGNYFKVVREMGMFHKTLSRDVLLPAETDSVNLLDTNMDEVIQLRVFYRKNNQSQHSDLNIKTGNHRDDSKDLKQIRN